MYIPALHLTDGYKVDHRRQYPKNTVKVYSNLTPRKSRVPGVDSIVFFGLTYFIKDVIIEEFKKTFFSRNKDEVIKKYKRRLDNYLGPNDITYEHIESLHDLGYLPVTIKGLPEGALVKTGVPVLTITNEISEFFWVPNFLETILSCELWPMCTSATTAFNYRLVFDSYALKTTGSTEFSSTFQAHDFSFRGLVGRQAPPMIGAGHLTAFAGTDTIPAIDFLEEFYNADSDKELVGASIAATEHSVMCMGMQGGELATFKRLISEIYPRGFVAIVSDTWDFWHVIRPVSGILATLYDDIIARDGRLVIRPDSGDPVKIITGYKIYRNEIDLKDHNYIPLQDSKAEAIKTTDGRYLLVDYHQDEDGFPIFKVGKEITYEEAVGAIQCLWDIFGGTVTEQGYKVLDTHIGLIYGDSITLDRAKQICQRLMDNGFASTNWVAGVGSYTYQYVTRDTYGFAMKATYGEIGHPVSEVTIDGVNCDFVTDDGWHDSKDPGDTDLLFIEGYDSVFQDAITFKQGVNKLTHPFYVVEPREIFKDPITDDGTKKSAKGMLKVVKDLEGNYALIDQVTAEDEAMGELEVYYENSELVKDSKLSEIRQLVNVNVLRKLVA